MKKWGLFCERVLRVAGRNALKYRAAAGQTRWVSQGSYMLQCYRSPWVA